MLFKKKDKKKDFIAGGIVPIVRCVRYNHNIKANNLKETLIKNMVKELMNYAEFTEEVEENGVTLLSARLDVLRRDKEIDN